MMYTIDMNASDGEWVNFAPESVPEEVGQNIRCIVSTLLGSAPGAREIGVDYSDLQDEPVPILRARLGGMIATAILEQEPRARPVSIDFTESEEETSLYGRLIPVITYILAEEAAI